MHITTKSSMARRHARAEHRAPRPSFRVARRLLASPLRPSLRDLRLWCVAACPLSLLTDHAPRYHFFLYQGAVRGIDEIRAVEFSDPVRGCALPSVSFTDLLFNSRLFYLPRHPPIPPSPPSRSDMPACPAAELWTAVMLARASATRAASSHQHPARSSPGVAPRVARCVAARLLSSCTAL